MHACLSFVSVHQMAPPRTGVRDIQLQLTLPIYRPRRDERLSWPGREVNSSVNAHIHIVTPLSVVNCQCIAVWQFLPIRAKSRLPSQLP